ncbi:hypothetical protein HYH03_014568 [Edaphochlamys debaryana]|uniref:NADP-dependent oxidoreductase domain-containing protein n=1 Tax=Edaphochlamys debaryana TaxID=47281 RepID=A0A835XVV9_9CHLO|nr:hypothetical protein HYH03_014568 [Edaphochlamys debaryana]|eukprot:KAG2486769.1 hypothetical protein HYH03_014568 [Edaphochlamys debaryana]
MATQEELPSLPRRPLGRTGLEVSVLGFGASPFGGAFGPIDEAEAVKVVHHAFRRGINVFDTSPFYGATKSEKVLGQGLKDLPRSEIVVCTKVGRYGNRDFDFSAARVTASVKESLERLQVPYIDVIQCHDIEFGDLDQIVSETLPALAALKAAGLVRHVGVTGLPLAALQYVLDRVAPGSVDTVLSYCHYCVNDTTLASVLPKWTAAGLGVFSASPLSMGLLTNAGPPDWHPAPPELRQAAQAAAAHAASRGYNIADLALRFAMRQPSVASTYVGLPTMAMVDVNIDTTLRALGLAPDAPPPPQAGGAGPDQVLAEVEALLAPVKDLTWPSGRPLPTAA